jgi:hypothetical protein
MMNGTDPQVMLNLAKMRGAELRAEAERFRLARLARAHAWRARRRPEEAGEQQRARPRPVCGRPVGERPAAQ